MSHAITWFKKRSLQQHRVLRQSRPILRTQTYPLALEQLEDRTLPSVTLFSNDPQFAALCDITTDGTSGFWVDGVGNGFASQQIFKLGMSGGAATDFAAAFNPQAVTTDGTYLFWIDPNGDPDATAIFRV